VNRAGCQNEEVATAPENFWCCMWNA